jgi:hypothetical protein
VVEGVLHDQLTQQGLRVEYTNVLEYVVLTRVCGKQGLQYVRQ